MDSETSTVMPVQPLGYGGYGYGGNVGYSIPMVPAYGNYGGGFGSGFGSDWGWIILLLLFAGGGWGNGGFGGGYDFPWLLNGQNQITASTADGFRSAAISSQLGDIQNSITAGFSSSEVAACNRAMQDQANTYNSQIAALNRSFDAQTAVTAGQNALAAQLADCCCENRLATQGLQNVIQSENAADREALSNGIRDILTAQNAGTQRILDKLCDQELQAAQRENNELRTRLNMADLAASQAAQTAALVADNTAQTQYIVNRVAPYPIPAYPVSNPYGYNGFGYGYNGFNNGFGFNPFGNVGFGNGSF